MNYNKYYTIDAKIAYISTEAPYNLNGMPITEISFSIPDYNSNEFFNFNVFSTRRVRIYCKYDNTNYIVCEFNSRELDDLTFDRLLESDPEHVQFDSTIAHFVNYLHRSNITFTSNFVGYQILNNRVQDILTNYAEINHINNFISDRTWLTTARGDQVATVSQPESYTIQSDYFQPTMYEDVYIPDYNTMFFGEPVCTTARYIDTSTISTTEEIKYVHNYNYRPDFKKHKTSSDSETPLYLGAEIEIDKGGQDNHSVMKKALQIMNESDETKEKYIYGMHDGSLPQGFEIATMPMTLSYHKSLPYKKLFDYLTSQNYRAHNTQTCGLHIHINRDYFGDTLLTQQIAISCLTYLIETYWDEIKIIARRDSNRYCSRFNKKKEDTVLNMFSKVNNGSKYSAVNLQHSETIELRIFKGTLKTSTFINTLEFVSVMADICKNTSIYDVEKITWEDIYNKFSQDLKDYYKERKNRNSENTITSEDNVEDDMTAIATATTSSRNRTAINPEQLYSLRGFCNGSINCADAITNATHDFERELQQRIFDSYMNITATFTDTTPEVCWITNPVRSTVLDERTEQYKQKIKSLKKQIKAAKRRNDYITTTTLERELSDTRRAYNEYKRRQRNNQNVA